MAGRGTGNKAGGADRNDIAITQGPVNVHGSKAFQSLELRVFLSRVAALKCRYRRGQGSEPCPGQALDRGKAACVVKVFVAVDDPPHIPTTKAKAFDVGGNLRRRIGHPGVDQHVAVG